ncbi:TetR/AcrR family transcriptional regulator [Muricauda sp. JGD-17]|uniref:TetR/AcrR family transcriptional regulator n=1 Tax=Flagellimonas ochracea TaxID=2696472 RepID=A0A964TFF9_9FLAO|nr:TetR family transcriptional regulator C-terminal domain-containing protein [Allomuricauda ochracea]NAY93273.1 TetR/AcrR family transcriptional regulator [Allomuricauda ochracea]
MAKETNSKRTAEDIITFYMHHVLENEAEPKSIFKFCKEQKIKETDFYKFFGSFESLQKAIWEKFFDNSIGLIKKNKDYASMTNEEKMLTFFFTFFENLNLNRSYVLFVLDGKNHAMEKMAQLKGLRKKMKAFASELIEEGNQEKQIKLLQHNEKLFSEGAWLQFLFLLRFWMQDSSPGFEKTDIAIEKSVTTIFQVFENTPLEKILDFGKFLYKENFA